MNMDNPRQERREWWADVVIWGIITPIVLITYIILATLQKEECEIDHTRVNEFTPHERGQCE